MTDLEKVKAALAEMGYADAKVGTEFCPTHGIDEVFFDDHGPVVPLEVVWMSFFVIRRLYVCWPCWSSGVEFPDCDHDPYTSERPRLPVRT